MAQSAEAIHEQYPDQTLAYNCSSSFKWWSHLDPLTTNGLLAGPAMVAAADVLIWLTGYLPHMVRAQDSIDGDDLLDVADDQRAWRRA